MLNQDIVIKDDNKFKKIHDDILDISEEILAQLQSKIKYCDEPMELKTLVSCFKDVAGVVKVYSPTEKPKADVTQLPDDRAKDIYEQLSLRFKESSE